MKRLIPRLFSLLLLALAVLPGPRAGAERKSGAGAEQQSQAPAWTGVRSQNFFVAGVAGEKELRRVAVRLEEYRAAFSRLLSPEHFDPGVPTTVVVFPDDAAYNPFKPILGGHRANSVAGYFQPGADVNYITVTLDSDFELDTLLHEYTHLLVNNYFRGAPLWLKEGLAEFYSTARLSADRRRVTLGESPGRRARELRGRALIPLSTLFNVDQNSPYYYEASQRGLFYAESWALVHYLLVARGGERRDGLDRFTSMLAEGSTPEEALRGAFGIGLTEAETGLASYVQFERFRSGTETFERPLDFDSQLNASALAEPEGLALLGDLLLHTERDGEAEEYLLRAVALDPRSAPARVSLGVLRLRQNRTADAREELQKAVALAPASHLAHFHLAEALNRDDTAPEQSSIKAFEERTDAIRAELRRAIELAPGFVEPYKLLATVEMERGDRPEEAAAILTRALALSPRRADLTLMLAQAHLLAGRFDDARNLAEPVALHSTDARLREQAGLLLTRISVRREEAERKRAQAEEEARADREAPPAQPCDMPLRGGPQYKHLRFEGAQVCGRLSEIECDKAGVVFNIMTDAGATLRLRAGDLQAVRFVTYTTAVKTGRISCGPREQAARALVTYRPNRDERSGSDGEAVAVEFVPEDWNR
ncbi:MAG TPA: tetratricopeptide repeat protein [Pyrinomonadaceae bacterium]|nr:tetratricopeptide repeat protein [Pyrinomonadaceae bacterium]